MSITERTWRLVREGGGLGVHSTQREDLVSCQSQKGLRDLRWAKDQRDLKCAKDQKDLRCAKVQRALRLAKVTES